MSRGLHHSRVSINFLAGSPTRGTSRFWFPLSPHPQTPPVLSSRYAVPGRSRACPPCRWSPQPAQPLPLPARSARGSVPRAAPTPASRSQTQGLLASCPSPLYKTLAVLRVPPYDSSSSVFIFSNYAALGLPSPSPLSYRLSTPGTPQAPSLSLPSLPRGRSRPSCP